MTRAQGYALSVALAGQDIGHQLVFSYDAQGAETCSASLDTAIVYTGAQLQALSEYCANKGLILSMAIATMGVV